MARCVVYGTEEHGKASVPQCPIPPPSAVLRNGVMVEETQVEGEGRQPQYQHATFPQIAHSIMENKGRGSREKGQKSSELFTHSH